MSTTSARLALGFSCIGHMFSHLFAPIFFMVAAVSLEGEWRLTHGEAVLLIFGGNMLFGVAAPLAGWLGDRWGNTSMMGVFFVGTGAGMVATGLAGGPVLAAVFLAVTGLFASIYHPVGIAWLVSNAEKRGAALGINGVFGAFGTALGGLMAAALIDLWGWRSAFFVPGGLMIATWIVFQWMRARGLIIEATTDRRPDSPASRDDRIRAFTVLAVTMLCTGLVYQATQAGLPKLFDERLDILASGSAMDIGKAVALAYSVAAVLQILAGYLADRYPLKVIYLGTFLFQAPLLFLAASMQGLGLVVVAMIMVSLNVGALPAENMLVARFAPDGRRGLVFGFKFILAFGLSGGLGVLLEGGTYDFTGGFYWLFVILAGIALVGAAAGFLLPSERRQPSPAAAE